jgi:hypothetical protein
MRCASASLDRGKGCKPACQRRKWRMQMPQLSGPLCCSNERTATATINRSEKYVHKDGLCPLSISCTCIRLPILFPFYNQKSCLLFQHSRSTNAFKKEKLFGLGASNCLPQKLNPHSSPRAHTAKQGKERHKNELEPRTFCQKSGAILLISLHSRLPFNFLINHRWISRCFHNSTNTIVEPAIRNSL